MADAIDLPQSTDTTIDSTPADPAQRLSLDRLKRFQELRYGMFIHWGMSTYDGKELSSCEPIETYNPTNLDVGQWVSTARDAGMKYAVLTTKHVAGHALWPSKYGKYSVAHSRCKTDVVGEFVNACRDKGVKPCFYYCAWDNTNLFGMEPTPDWAEYAKGMIHTNDAYREFMSNQVDELLENYGPIEMLWVDIPHVLPMDYRYELYKRATAKDPNMIFLFNHSCQNGTTLNPKVFWPTDVMTLERTIPNHAAGHAKQSYYCWKNVMGKDYYIPGEHNDTIGREWFWQDDDKPRSDHDLLGMVLMSTARGVNCLLNVPPDKSGVIPDKWIQPLQRLRKNLDTVGFF